MKLPRLPFIPLSARILLWFFLNVLLLGGVSLVLFNAQFRFDLNWLLASNARERIEAMRDLVAGDLNSAAPDEWESVIERYSQAYHVQLTLLDDEGDHLIGPVVELPEKVRTRFSPWSRTRNYRDLVRTTNPSHYWLLTSMRLYNPQAGGQLHTILLADSSTVSMGGLIVDLRLWVKLGLAAVVLSVLFWFPLLRGITRSIGKMRAATRRIAEGRFDVRVSERRNDELGGLAGDVNQMALRLDGFVKGQRRFLGDVAHELCAPLAKLQMALGILESRLEGNESANYAKTAQEKAEQISTLVNALLAFSKASFGAQSVKLVPVDVHNVVEKAVTVEGAQDVTLEIPASLSVMADAELLLRALSNLIRNAIKHNDQSGKILINATRTGDTVTIRVADCGTGVPEEELPKIFDAFYRLDTARTRETGGVGLGLTIVKTCVESCHGTVTARNRQPHGLEVIITLPAA